MEQLNKTGSQRDDRLWSLAKKRASFKMNLVYYFVINAFLWIVWLLGGAKVGSHGIPWPVWSTLGWGIGMIFYYFSVYRHPEESATEKEYEKLKRQQNQ